MQLLLDHIKQGDAKSLARAISIIENEAEGYEELLLSLSSNPNTKIIGITGSPGVGKSTLTDSLIACIINERKKVGVLCIDPSSPFNLGALLGDRIRMSEWYNHQNVFIRSLASRGNLGGLNPKIIEITELMKAAPFDYIIIETAPISAVTDAYILSKFCDATLCVVRYGLTSKDDIKVIEENMQFKGLVNPAIVFNGVRLLKSGNNGYGYGYQPVKGSASESKALKAGR